ncbi:DUF1566 domain-containing protein [Psychrobacter sp. I-STPA6b]|uniref:Lcl C-terminal domain-containing protein n=1 Tax=Psychrobacter sp. I-STPA6b TaxID=2585718 RepID=UPI001D0C2B15|nr:DUF1566 domain-containing protein [Psychrobacter sp. I-STPA6b]
MSSVQWNERAMVKHHLTNKLAQTVVLGMPIGLSAVLISILSGCVTAQHTTYPNGERNTDIKRGILIDHYTVFDDGTAIDNDTRMMWSRCSIGQTWNGKTCIGEANKYTWNEAVDAVKQLNTENYLGYDDWQMPHIEDLHSLIYCNKGFVEMRNIPTKMNTEKQVGWFCQGGDYGYQKPTINQQAFPNTIKRFYWSSSVQQDDYMWGIYFDDGYSLYHKKHDRHYVRPIRLVQ